MTLYKRRERFQGFSVKLGRAFSRLGLSPNQWTLLALVPVLAAFYLLAREQFLFAGLLFLLSGIIDMIDGAVARVSERVTKRGAYLDTVVDRYVEVIIVFGLLFAALPAFFFPAYVWIFLYLFGAMMTTYAKAAAREKELVEPGRELRGGLLERAERLILLFAGIILAHFNPLYLTSIIIIMAILANVSALQRIVVAWKGSKAAK